MSPHTPLIAILCFLLSVMAAFGEDRIDCKAANSTVEMAYCAEQEYSAADKGLNEVYRRALATIRQRDLDKPYDAASFELAMRASQRAWVAYRDADCKDLISQEWSGGTGTGSATLNCMTGKTRARTKELKERYTEQ